MPAPTDPEERRRRRALLRAHHPDLGGDTSEFLRIMAVLEGRAHRGGGTGSADDVRFVRRPRGLARIAAWYRRRRRPRRVL